MHNQLSIFSKSNLIQSNILLSFVIILPRIVLTTLIHDFEHQMNGCCRRTIAFLYKKNIRIAYIIPQ